jgi:hypothetical protein
MSRSPQIPHDAVILRTYAELAAEADAFFGDYYDELLVVGPPGIGKSETFKRRIRSHPERCHYIEGNTKPLATYMECWRQLHKLLVFDDAEGLWSTDNGKHLLRQLTQHAISKYIQWLSTVKELDRNGIPNSFATTSKCAFLMNRFVASNNDHFYSAILDRGHVFYFDPPAKERHRYVATWFHDQEIHDFVGANLHLVNNLTARTYNLLDQKKRAGHDWRQYFYDRFCHATVLLMVQQLENDNSFQSVEYRVQEFVRRGLGCRRTYFNYKNELSASGQLQITPEKPLRVQGTPPAPFNRDELLKQRIEEEGQQEEADEEVCVEVVA